MVVPVIVAPARISPDEAPMMQLEDSLGIAALESPSRDGHHAELLRLTAELVDSSGHAPSRTAETCPVEPTN